MVLDKIRLEDIPGYSPLVSDYIKNHDSISFLFNRKADFSSFLNQILDKKEELRVNKFNRDILATELYKQYKDLTINDTVNFNIESLKYENTFTVTTGHQLNLFTGPLFFIYKVIAVINLAKELKLKYPNYNFVPIYWMASEDHDFEEINHFNFNDTKYTWHKASSQGPVGRFDLKGIKKLIEVYSSNLNDSDNSNHIQNLLNDFYAEGNLALATRKLVNKLFEKDGLVILDGDSKVLKSQFTSIVKKDIQERISYLKVNNTNLQIQNISKKYKIQVTPRDINFFYILDGLRERIVFNDNKFRVLNTDIVWSTEELENHIDEFPERFSPNVLMRPLYQEKILPNLSYTGGAGEISYWLQLKSTFDAHKLKFPILIPRNSALIVSNKQNRKLKKLGVNYSQLFLKNSDLDEDLVKKYSSLPLSLNKQKESLIKQFEELHKLAALTDKSFEGAVAAQETKQLKGLNNLEKRLIRAEKKSLENKINRVKEIKLQLFPMNNFQERVANFSEFYLEYGELFFKELKLNIAPLDLNFIILEIN